MRTLVKNIKELIQAETNPRLKVCGKDMAVLPTIKNAYLIVEDDKIAAFGEMKNLAEQTFDREIDASGKMVFPSFCDSHTHLIYAGSREIEYIDNRANLGPSGVEEFRQLQGPSHLPTHTLSLLT